MSFYLIDLHLTLVQRTIFIYIFKTYLYKFNDFIFNDIKYLNNDKISAMIYAYCCYVYFDKYYIIDILKKIFILLIYTPEEM